MEKDLRIYDYSDVNIISMSISSNKKFTNRYKYYYKYTRKVKKINKFHGDMRLNSPGFLKENNFIKSIKKFFRRDNNEEDNNEYIKETYENVLVCSNMKVNNVWAFNNETDTIFHKNENFIISEEDKSIILNYTNSYPFSNKIIFTFHSDIEKAEKEDRVNSDIEIENIWVGLDFSYNVKINKIKKDKNETIFTDCIYFLSKEDLNTFLKWIQRFISKESTIIDNTGKIIKINEIEKI